MHKKYNREITNIYLSDMNNILNGLISIKDAIDASVTADLQNNVFMKIGGKLDINVTTKQGNILYPATYQNSAFDNFSTDPARLAEKNFDILNEGIDVIVNVKILHYSFLAIALLLFYILIFLGGLYGYYRKISTKIHLDELQKNKELNRLHELENKRLQEIDILSEERESLLSEFDQLKSTFKKEKSQAEITEEDLFEEIELLENKLKEIDRLKGKIQELEKSQNHISRQKDKTVEKLGKRFKALYKNIEITNRALASLTDMTDEMSLKAEELIHQLNNDPSLVPVKRKVFSKKGKTTCFEVVFAYNGRLYFRKSKEKRIEILTIGSKNTQQKDMAFIDSL
ncbi:MAG: hypothetical protein HF978_12755 [Desulfobacteraceae bacterium]|nr:hypothetical protein [Desulfobacteraceae bacterium]MBC2756409.1 hypothetical protein [Desulfobacteraceae bacterium]